MDNILVELNKQLVSGRVVSQTAPAATRGASLGNNNLVNDNGLAKKRVPKTNVLGTITRRTDAPTKPAFQMEIGNVISNKSKTVNKCSLNRCIHPNMHNYRSVCYQVCSR